MRGSDSLTGRRAPSGSRVLTCCWRALSVSTTFQDGRERKASSAWTWKAMKSLVASAGEVASASSVVMMPVISRSMSALSARAMASARRSLEARSDCV